MADFLPGEVDEQVTITDGTVTKTAQRGKREGEETIGSELDRMLEEGWEEIGSSDTKPSSSTSSKTAQGIAEAMVAFMPPDVIAEYAKGWTEFGTPEVALAKTRQSAAWKKEFGFLERDDGSLIMDELTALSTKASYKETLAEVGVTNFEDYEKSFEAMISGGEKGDPVSAAEFQDRVDLVYSQVVDQIPEVRQLFADRFGIDLDSGTVFSALINPEVEDKLLAGDISSLQISAQAKKSGFSNTFQRFESLRRLGMTVDSAQQLYGNAQATISAAGTVGRELDIGTLEDASVGKSAAQATVARISGELASQEAMTLGASKKDGKVTGLIE